MIHKKNFTNFHQQEIWISHKNRITTTYLVGHLESETICSYEIQ